MQFFGDVARKSGIPELLALEAEKTERAARLGLASGLFHVPRVLSFDSRAGILETERIPNLQSLAKSLVLGQTKPNLFESIGYALLYVHNEFWLPDKWKFALPPELMILQSDHVFLHGDLSMGNVCTNLSGSRIVLVDWSGAPLFKNRFSFGPRQFDLVWFSFCLFCSMPIPRFFDWNAKKHVSAFLRGYEEGGTPLDWSAYQVYSAVLAPWLRSLLLQKVQQSRGWKRPFHHICGIRIWQHWRAFIEGREN